MKLLVIYYDGNAIKACAIESEGPYGIERQMPDDCETINAVVELPDDATPHADYDWEYLVVTDFPNDEANAVAL